MKTAAAFATNAWSLDPARKTNATFVAANQCLAKKGKESGSCPSSNDLRLFWLWKNGVSGSVCVLI
jgi:hypothetical protein